MADMLRFGAVAEGLTRGNEQRRRAELEAKEEARRQQDQEYQQDVRRREQEAYRENERLRELIRRNNEALQEYQEGLNRGRVSQTPQELRVRKLALDRDAGDLEQDISLQGVSGAVRRQTLENQRDRLFGEAPTSLRIGQASGRAALTRAELEARRNASGIGMVPAREDAERAQLAAATARSRGDEGLMPEWIAAQGEDYRTRAAQSRLTREQLPLADELWREQAGLSLRGAREQGRLGVPESAARGMANRNRVENATLLGQAANARGLSQAQARAQLAQLGLAEKQAREALKDLDVSEEERELRLRLRLGMTRVKTAEAELQASAPFLAAIQMGDAGRAEQIHNLIFPDDPIKDGTLKIGKDGSVTWEEVDGGKGEMSADRIRAMHRMAMGQWTDPETQWKAREGASQRYMALATFYRELADQYGKEIATVQADEDMEDEEKAAAVAGLTRRQRQAYMASEQFASQSGAVLETGGRPGGVGSTVGGVDAGPVQQFLSAVQTIWSRDGEAAARQYYQDGLNELELTEAEAPFPDSGGVQTTAAPVSRVDRPPGYSAAAAGASVPAFFEGAWKGEPIHRLYGFGNSIGGILERASDALPPFVRGIGGQLPLSDEEEAKIRGRELERVGIEGFGRPVDLRGR